MKSLHLLVEKHKYQYLILASLILVACHTNSVSRVNTIQLNLNTDFESNLICVTMFTSYCSVYVDMGNIIYKIMIIIILIFYILIAR